MTLNAYRASAARAAMAEGSGWQLASVPSNCIAMRQVRAKAGRCDQYETKNNRLFSIKSSGAGLARTRPQGLGRFWGHCSGRSWAQFRIAKLRAAA